MMKKRWLLIVAVILLTLGFHYGISAWQYYNVTNKWAGSQGISYLKIYFKQQEYFLGLSYGLAAGFTVFSIFKMFENQKKGVAGAIGGTALMAVIYWGSCFLIGCCGSPMLTVYLSLLGASFLGFTKSIIFVITIISVAISYYMLQRKSNCACSEGTCEKTNC
ncbi:MAG TPA: hypothetical protein VHY08_13345 [Bacillota bacterium]|nr:hypothetical protein [Bacillota bacterium]